MKAAIPAMTQCRNPKKYRAHIHGTAAIKKRTEPLDCFSAVRYFIEYVRCLTTESSACGTRSQCDKEGREGHRDDLLASGRGTWRVVVLVNRFAVRVKTLLC